MKPKPQRPHLPAEPARPSQQHNMEPQSLAGADCLMDPRTTAMFLGLSVLSLADWRTKGVGITYIKVGRSVRYRMSDVQAYLASHTKQGA
jgi:hypothetical protein